MKVLGDSEAVASMDLQTAEHEELLNVIDTLRSQGISQYVDLPQLIVCGDQSSGKSSVLEAISGLRFPTKDNLCTRFATELILRRASAEAINVTILPDGERSEQAAEALSKFQSPSDSLDDFADIVTAAEKAMNLDESEAVFSKDTLRVELCGPKQPNLTLVDLPGIFWAGDETQSDDDAALVQAMVRSYMEKSRSIILAVVSAKSDLAMQVVTRLAREIDPNGLRTLGIITKPDTLFAGSDSEAAFVKLAKNENIRFKLGWHVLKNRDYDTKDSTRAERDAAERGFFQKRVWSTAVSNAILGINSLRPRLSKLLQDQILAELPSLRQDVETELEACKSRLEALGASRGTIMEQRRYLLDASKSFGDIIKEAVKGEYSRSFFGTGQCGSGREKRLRAFVQAELAEFNARMLTEGCAVKIVDDTGSDSSSPSEDLSDDSQNNLPAVSRDEYLTGVRERMRRNRGCELPGLFNPSIVGDLFIEQSKPWSTILGETEGQLVHAARTLVSLAVHEVCDATTADAIMRLLLRESFENVVKQLHQKVQELLKPYLSGHPITYNHYFIENLQKKREEAFRDRMANSLQQFFGIDPREASSKVHNGAFDVKGLWDALVLTHEPDMEKFASIEATNAMQAYYKVALKSIVDSFSVLAVEECLMQQLPHLFNPRDALELKDEVVARIAGESPDSLAEREELTKKLKILDETMTTLQRLKTVSRAA